MTTRIFSFPFRLGIALATATAGTLSSAVETSDVRKLVAGNNGFAADLYAKLRDQSGNIFISPYSVSLALAMTYSGARGQTAKDMAKALGFAAGPSEIAGGFAALAGRLASLPAENAILSIGNSLWYQRDFHFAPAYLQLARTDFRARISPVDFVHDPDSACTEINRWVDEATQGKILNLVSPGALGAGTRVVLCNAIYFKGLWAQPFRKERTVPAAFFISPDQPVNVPMMLQRSDFRTAGEPDFGLIELPYRGGSLSMIILLPDAADGLAAIESRMRDSTLADWLAQLEASTAEEVDLSLPRFTATCGFDLSQALGQMGMSSAFDSARADFSGMTGARDVFISRVLHKAYVEVNEEGTVAAAATGSVMFSQAMRRPRVFRVDHPFLFLIRENSTGSILFLGRIADPR